MSRENSNLEDSGEVVFNPRSYMGSPNLCKDYHVLSSPKQASATHQSENINEQLLDALQNMSKEFLFMKQDVGKQISEVMQESQRLQSEIDKLKHKDEPNTQSMNGYGGSDRYPTMGMSHGMGDDMFGRITNHRDLEFRDKNENTCTARLAHAASVPRNSVGIKPQTFDGSDDFDEYLTQFNILAKLHNWDHQTKSLCLASSLTGGARAVLTELNESQRYDFHSLVRALNTRYGSIERSEMYRAQLKGLVKGNNESIPELSQSIKKLTRRAYPTADPAVTDTLALDYFIDALTDSDMRLRLRKMRPRNINEAEILAIRFETHKLADAQRAHSINNIKVSPEQDIVGAIKKAIGDDLQALTKEIQFF